MKWTGSSVASVITNSHGVTLRCWGRLMTRKEPGSSAPLACRCPEATNRQYLNRTLFLDQFSFRKCGVSLEMIPHGSLVAASTDNVTQFAVQDATSLSSSPPSVLRQLCANRPTAFSNLAG